jgi:hypothetical protein
MNQSCWRGHDDLAYLAVETSHSHQYVHRVVLANFEDCRILHGLIIQVVVVPGRKGCPFLNAANGSTKHAPHIASFPNQAAIDFSMSVCHSFRFLTSSIRHSACIGCSQALALAMLPVLHQERGQCRLPASRDGRDGGLTSHTKNLRSVSPLRSACNLLSSLSERRTTRAATARYRL